MLTVGIDVAAVEIVALVLLMVWWSKESRWNRVRRHKIRLA